MMRYFRQTKHALSFPEFQELATENKKDLETNFKKAFKDMEVSHFRKLSRMQVNCDQATQMFMEDRLKRVMNYATTLLHADITKFTKLMYDMTEYQGQLQHGLSNCITYVEKNSQAEHFERAGLSFDLCYGNEVVTLIKFLTNFTRLAEDLTQKVYKEKHTKIELIKAEGTEEPPKVPPKVPPTMKEPPTKEPQTTKKPLTKKPPTTEGPPTDLEDGDDQEESGSGSGSGSGDKEDKPVPEKTNSKPIPEEKPTPTPEKKVKHEPTKPSISTPVSKEEEKPTTEPNLDAAKEFFNNLEPGPVIIDTKKVDEEEPEPDNKPLSKGVL